MAENSKIEWTHHTFNPWRGCTKVSAGCKHCYAETLSGRNPGTLGIWGKNGTRAIGVESYWKQPIKWNKDAALAGERRRVFCASLADVFEGPESMPADAVELVAAARRRLFDLIQATPNLDWLLLTKRPENITAMLPLGWGDGYPNVWLGTSVEDQAAADKRIPILLAVPARVRFLSCEPLLGSVDLGLMGTLPAEISPRYSLVYERLHWVIVGGESGGGARPMHPEWARSLRDQCTSAGVAFHFKQWGEWSEWQEGTPFNPKTEMHQFAGGATPYSPVYRIGKKAAGRVLDGRTWDELPL